MTCTNNIEAGHLFSNADVLNNIILDRITRDAANAVQCRLNSVGDFAYVRARSDSRSCCTQNIELMEQMQNLRSVIDLLMELRR